ncbi:MAG: SNF2 helicase-associated domain-containing protein, partial [Planctomycetaceae bacterium]|nr:SNF2 helicase-associated domain-containing protein [Planctomycetaceae bacterium]
MGCALALGPTGRLRLEDDAEAADANIAESLRRELRNSLAVSNAAGLVSLALPTWPTELPATLAYWRNWVRVFFRAVCHSEEEPGTGWRALPLPADDELAALVASAPLMVGLEFVTTERLRESWRALAEHVADAATSDPGGPLAWLRRVNPLAHLVGKVTFHLAENKRDPDRPFAFLATFAHKLSAGAKPQHRPLAEALKQSVATRDLEQLQRLLEPVRKAAEHSPLAAELLRSKRLFAAQAWTAPEAYRFLQESSAMEAAGVVIRLPNWWSARRSTRPEVQVRIGEKRPSALGFDSLLDFEAAVVLDGEPLSPEELQQLLADSPGLTLLRGKWVEVDQHRLREALDHWKTVSREYPDGIEMLEAMRMLAGATIAATPAAADERVANWSTLVAGDWLRTTLERMRQPDEATGCQPGRDLQATLRPYQAEGVQWLWFMTELGLGACLADDMGLGKSIQVLDLLLQRKRAAERASVPPSLLVVPASLIGNWKQEALRFAPSLRICFAHRSEMPAEELAERALDPSVGFAEFDLVVTSYGMVRRQPWLEKVTWSLIILDEAQAIKNAGSAQARALKKLPAHRRMVMTGTPVEN